MRRGPEVMRPEHLGAFSPSAVSFSRSLVRKMIAEQWQIRPRLFELNDVGAGLAIYAIDTGSHLFEFVAIASEPPESETAKSDRIIGGHWDMIGALLEGRADEERIELTRRQFPKLYRGRAAPDTLIWGRLNRSYRLFDHVVESLATGRQPDPEQLALVNYIGRNTGLDGNGTFGTRAYLAYDDSHPLVAPYHPQMLTAFVMREFAADCAEHLARVRSSRAVALDPEMRRFLGFGNSSALGLVLFTNNHPTLINRWIELREAAIAHAKAMPLRLALESVGHLASLVRRAARFKREDRITYGVFTPSSVIASELEMVNAYIDELADTGRLLGRRYEKPWAALCDLVEQRFERETTELLYSLLTELDPEFADRLTTLAAASEVMDLDPTMRCDELRELLHLEYAWAFAYDFTKADSRKYFWYKSAEAEEPRRGIRGGEVTGRDLAIDVPGDVQTLDRLLKAEPRSRRVGEFVLAHPQLRFAIERVQALRGLEYHSPYMNMLSDDLMPAHLIRLVKGTIYGSDKCKDVEASLGRWVRGVFFHGAPSAREIADGATDDWIYPREPRIAT